MWFHKKILKAFFSDIADRYNLNTYLTVSFVGLGPAKRIKLTRRDVADAERLMAAYARHITRKMFGRSNRLDRTLGAWLPMMAFPEFRERGSSDPTHIHYHALIHFPDGHEQQLEEETRSFWSAKGETHFGAPIVPDIRMAYTPGKVARYNLKFLDDDTTIEKAIFRGPLIEATKQSRQSMDIRS